MVATPPGRILVRSPTLLVGYLILAQNRPLIGNAGRLCGMSAGG